MRKVNEQLLALVALQDLDSMIRENSDKAHAKKLKGMGFALEGIEDIQAARQDLADQIDRPLLNRYERIAKRLGRAIVPVTGKVCLGCFAVIPTAYTSSENADKILSCEQCGRILYWP